MATDNLTEDATELYGSFVNPQWVKLLDVLQMNVDYVRCSGSELFTSDEKRILDFNSGYCVHNAGYNHPRIIAALKDELDRKGPAMLQSHVSEYAGELARRLCALAGGRVTRAFFGSSGSEGIEAVIKFSRAHTGRSGIVYAEGGFHGLTCGALSLMANPFWRDGFGPLLPDTEAVPFGKLEALAAKLATGRFAAFVVEPVQAEGGVILPPTDYLREAQALCRKHGTLFVLDEVQTGLYRTGPFLAAHHYGVEPDMVVLAKALSGGLIPVSAVLMTDAICDSVYSSIKRAFVHTSTFSENSMAMRAALATLDVLEDEGLGERAAATGERLRTKLAAALSEFEMVASVRGVGLLSGIEFRAPRTLSLRAAFEAFAAIHPGVFGQILVMRIFRDHGILSQICGNNFLVLKVSPPLGVEEEQVDYFVRAMREVVTLMHTKTSFWTEALGLARRALSRSS
jgi:ornithine--oxo-acid transaminase